MKRIFLYKTPTIKQANIFIILIIFLFSMIFVALLVDEMYKDYEQALEKTYLVNNGVISKDNILVSKHQTLKSITIKTVLVIVTLSFILFGIFLGLNNIFNKLLNEDVRAFLNFFERVAHNEQVLNPHTMFFKEFKIMVKYANSMVNTIDNQKKSLKDLNIHLEDKVKEKTQDLENILAAQKEFLRYTVHETNTPLSVILTSLELYEMKNKKDKHLSKVEAAAKNIFSIYDDLSYLVKKDQVVYQKIAIDIEQFIRSRIDFFSEVALLSKVEFKFRTKVKDIYIYFNETKLQRVVDNTLTNAIKYTYQNEIIEIDLKYVGWHVDFSVGSKSQTIKDVDKIFDEYYREDTKRTQGFGIGLRLVKNICDEEDVKISISSNNKKNIFSYKFKVMGE